jgi:hypothetical protein
MARLTSAELVNDVRRTQTTQVSTRETPQQSYAGSQALNARGDHRSEIAITAIEDDSHESAASLRELVDDMHAICLSVLPAQCPNRRTVSHHSTLALLVSYAHIMKFNY